MALGADADEVGALLHRFHKEFDEPSPGAGVLSARVAEHIERGHSLFLLSGPVDVGVAQLRFRESLWSGSLDCYLEELYVVPDHRGHGHGRRLMDTALEAAGKRGATTMELGTALSDTAARGLYESLGFSNLEVPDDPQSRMLYYERDL